MLRKKIKKIWLVFLPILILAFFPFLTEAKDEIRIFVSPELFELKVERGEVLKNKIKIYNKSEIPLPIEVKVTNFGAQEESGTITFYDQAISKEDKDIEDDISFNARKWVKIKNPNFILDPEETERVEFSIEIPKDAELGGHYAVIIFEPKLPSFYFEKEALKVVPKIGVLLLFSVEIEGGELTINKDPLTVVEFNIPENMHSEKIENFAVGFAGLFAEVQAAEKETFSIIKTSHFPFALRIKNNDIYHIKPFGKLVILTDNGRIAGETEIVKTTILPGKIRKIPVEFKPKLPEKLEKYLPSSISNFISKNLLFGKYQARLTLAAERPEKKSLTSYNQENIIEESMEFWVFPWKIWLSTVLIFALTVFFVVKYRKRVLKAILILFKK